MKRFVFFFLILSSSVFAGDAISDHPEWDQDYSQKIREYTTSPEFLTDLVDHLPSSATVPTPQKFLGYIAGQPDHLTYAEDVHRYMRELESATPRVKVFSIGKSEEGREMILVAVADEETIRDLNHFQEINAKLSDPRKLNDADAASLISQGKPMYYITGAMHSPETGSPEMLMELAYRLAVEDTPMIRSIRSRIITLFTPVLEVDGRDRMVDLVRWQQANHASFCPPLIYWGHYVAHDNNRDMMGAALNLSRNILETFFQWHPQIVHDLHESVPFLYISTGTGPYNPSLDPIAINEWQRMAYHEVQALTEKGLPGVWTYGFYDGWAPNYMFWVAHGHNAIGRFYETYGNGVPATQDRQVRDQSARAWYRPNPPYPQVKWSLRNNTNYEESGILLALEYMAENPSHFLQMYYELGKRAIAKGTTEGPAAYVFDAAQKRQGQLRDLLSLLRLQRIEVHQLDQPVTVKLNWPPKRREDDKKKPAEKKPPESASFSAGSFVIRMDQPFSRFADTLLDTQYVKGDERVYDDTGWTLGYLKNVEFKRIVNQEILKAPMHLWNGETPAKPQTGAWLVIPNHADTDLVRLLFSLPQNAEIAVTDQDYKEKSMAWPSGSIVLHAADAQESLKSFSGEHYLVPSVPSSVKTHSIVRPRIAILHTWIDTQDEGWYRLAFESLNVPYAYISTQDVSRDPDLFKRFDVIVFPPTGSDPDEIVNGMPEGPPIPWKKTDLTPNLAVDQTEDIRPGLGLIGVENLRKFVDGGGLLIASRDAAEFAIQYGLAKYVKVVEPESLKARGSILAASVTDKNSPVAAGYDDTFPICYSGSPIFRVGIFEKNPPQGRPSGRGSKNDPDVPQGRPLVLSPDNLELTPDEEGFQPPQDFRIFLEPYIPSIEQRPRTIVSFAKDPNELLLSGMLEGGDEIAGKPVVIDAPLGKGHILLYANNPMWRQNTQGSFALIFNPILNWQNLNRPAPPKQNTK